MTFRIPLFKVHMAPKADLFPRLESVLYSGFVAEGEEVAAFERRLGSYLGNANVFATNSCTSGITVALRYLGVGPGCSVVCPPQTCIATATPVATLGAAIIWGDIDSQTGMLDPEQLDASIRLDTRAVIAVHWAGDVAEIAAIRKICQRRGVALIEDAAQAFGASYPDGNKVGSRTDTFACFSFQAIKHLTTGDGGVVTCPDAATEIVCDQLSWFGIDRDAFRTATGEINWEADVSRVGFKMHMNNIAAAIGNAQLEHVVGTVVPAHQRNGAVLDAQLTLIDEITIPARAGQSAYWTLSVHAQRRDELAAFLVQRGIQASRMHARIDKYSGFRTCPATYPCPALSGAEQFARTQLCLPCGWWMTAEDITYLVDSVKAFYAK